MQAKARGGLQAIAANRLEDGAAVWLGRDGSWVDRIEDSASFGIDAIAAALAAARASAQGSQVVDCYAIDVEMQGSRPAALHIRERMKAVGPSVCAGFTPAESPRVNTAV